jgi:hypothetical protein
MFGGGLGIASMPGRPRRCILEPAANRPKEPAMKKTLTTLAMLGALAVVAAPASAAKGVKYKGKTSEGLPVTFTYKNKRLYDMNSGIRVSCLPIQGGGSPNVAADLFSYKGYVGLSSKPVDFTFMKKPATYYNEVTTKHTMSTVLNRRTKAITGTRRIQYEYLIPKYTPGTFSIYSCLGNDTFKAKPVK